MGYDLFRNYVQNNKRKDRQPLLSEERHEEIKKYLLDGPNIVVADEAHKMKNADSGITKAAVQFRSTSRIALTGSPLANNVEEYHTMIDWVAPNYLGPAAEFRAKYVEPIQQGLWHDSHAAERRKSLKMLGVLKVDLAPKVHRADISVLRNDLPPKKEFVITVPLTDLQRKAYSIYVREMVHKGSYATTKTGEVAQATIWHWLAILSLLCNHPECFNKKLTERKEDARKEIGFKGTTFGSRDHTDHEEGITMNINEPIWKVGVSPALIEAVTELFESEAPNLKAINLSNKVKILCQILDGSKAVGDKVLVFSQSLPTLDYLQEMCDVQGRSYARLDGSTKMSNRQNLVKDFNTGDQDICLISTTAGGLGLNLPGANRVIIFDFKFNPIMEEQAVGRAYRIGQDKPVFVYRFVAGGTFETNVHNKTIFKMQLASRVVDKKSPIARASKRLSEFLFEPKHVDQMDLSEFEGMDPNVLDKILATQLGDPTIRAIIQTDTFERDDEDKLTLDEQKEVDQLLSDKQLQRSNPKAYTAMLMKRAAEEKKESRLPVLDRSLITSIGVYHQAQPHQNPPPLQRIANALPTNRPAASLSAIPTSMTSPTQQGHSISSAKVTPRAGHSQIAQANAKTRSITPEGRSSLRLQLVSQPTRAKSTTPVTRRTSSPARSPNHTTRTGKPYSRKIFDIVAAALESIGSIRDSSHLESDKKFRAAAAGVSADIMKTLNKFTNGESKKVAYRAVVAALQADPTKCKSLAVTRSETESFTLSFIQSPSEPDLELSSGAEGIENVCISKISIPPYSKSIPKVEPKALDGTRSLSSVALPHRLASPLPFELYYPRELREYLKAQNLDYLGSRAEMVARCEAARTQLGRSASVRLGNIAATREVLGE